jgi:hypothetical protein
VFEIFKLVYNFLLIVVGRFEIVHEFVEVVFHVFVVLEKFEHFLLFVGLLEEVGSFLANL